MATANGSSSFDTNQEMEVDYERAELDQMTLEIVPNNCSIKGESSFAVFANQVLPTGRYYVRFGKYGILEINGFDKDYLRGDYIPRARRQGTHPIPVDLCNEHMQCIGQCSLMYIDDKGNQMLRNFIPGTADSSSVEDSNSMSNKRSSSDPTDGKELYKKLEIVSIDTRMLVYLSDEMAKRGDKHFFDALNRLGVIRKVLENRCEYFEDVVTTARQHDHSELAVAIEKSSREKPQYSVIKELTLGALLDAFHIERSMGNFEPYLVEPKKDFALIISNQEFTGTTEEGVNLVKRRGSDTNVRRLKHALEELGYEVIILKNLEAAKILENVQNMAKKINDRQNSSSFVCFIGTHGDKGKIYGSDSKSIDLKEVTDAFKVNKCPCLTGKPKLFFIEACGKEKDAETDYLNYSEFCSRLDPAEPHFCIAISLAPENVSFKSEKDGTWIVSELLEILKHHKDQDVCSMLLKVNDNASKAHAKKGYKRPCQLVFTTTRIVKFPPTAGSNVPRMVSPLPIDEKCLQNETEQQSEKAAHSYHDDKYWCYPMDKQYNVAVIINVERFQELEHRDGTSYDVTKLQQLWKNLGFTVKVAESADFKGQSILAFLQQVEEEIDEKQNSSCFVCCIMTHGRMGKIYGSDHDSVNIKAILDLFKEANCRALAGKPKLFFIQACREIPKASSASTAAASDARENSKFMELANPHENDFLIGYSSLPGHKSFRYQSYRKRGTWYMQALVEVFQKYHDKEHLLSLMTRINKILEHTDQSPAPVLTLTGKIYFRSTASTLEEKQKNA